VPMMIVPAPNNSVAVRTAIDTLLLMLFLLFNLFLSIRSIC
jgi:hypothetical protein